jgi:Na/Pi-cotransporter
MPESHFRFTFDSRARLVFILLAGVFTTLAALPVLAAVESEQAINWGVMGMQLFGGLALFLFGMEQMADALKAVAGNRMKTILAKLTSNRFMGAITGAFVTAVIQSSSVTTVLVVGFITAGLMSMAQSVGVIMGANIGTTITAQIVAFKVTKAALLMIGVGFSMLFTSKSERTKQYGAMLMGLGLVFFGMSVMSDAMKPLRTYQPFLDLMIQMENPLIGIIIAAVFTGLIQSSSATTGIVIVMASQGFITLPAGIALAFGANIGTCVTAMCRGCGFMVHVYPTACARGDLVVPGTPGTVWRGSPRRRDAATDRQRPYHLQCREYADFYRLIYTICTTGGKNDTGPAHRGRGAPGHCQIPRTGTPQHACARAGSCSHGSAAHG